MPYADKQKQKEYKKAWNKQNYEKNKIRELKRIFRRKVKIKKWFEEYKAGLVCQKCGENESVCLDFHYIEEKNKDFNLGQVKGWGWGIERIKKELEKCMVLCANCHRKVHKK